MKKYIDRSAQTRFMEKMTWSKHPKPAIRRTHLRDAEKVSLLPRWRSILPLAMLGAPGLGSKFRARPEIRRSHRYRRYIVRGNSFLERRDTRVFGLLGSHSTSHGAPADFRLAGY
jgi:hypothetical protein